MSRNPTHKWWKTLCYSNISEKSDFGKLKNPAFQKCCCSTLVLPIYGLHFCSWKSPAGFKFNIYFMFCCLQGCKLAIEMRRNVVLEQHFRRGVPGEVMTCAVRRVCCSSTVFLLCFDWVAKALFFNELLYYTVLVCTTHCIHGPCKCYPRWLEVPLIVNMVFRLSW